MKNSFFEISSVAIIGASENEGKIGNTLLKNLLNFSGKKFGVNPKGGNYEDIIFYKSIEELPIVVDIAVIVIPAGYVQKSLIECGIKGIKRVIIISAGFKEIGNNELENNIINVSNKYNIDLLGPNCLGYIDTNRNLNLSFGSKNIYSCTGNNCLNIAMVSQSGAMAVALTDWAHSRNMGFSKMISMGNKAGINENFLLKELALDKETKVISLYLESIEYGEEFFQIIKKISKIKPIILVKSGISDRGGFAATSHTGALASKKEILDTVFSNSGVHSTNSLEDFFLWSQIFSKVNVQNIPEELVIITNAGGPGVMATDHTETYGVSLCDFTDNEKDILKNGLPSAASVSNPIDVIGDATSKTYKQILDNLTKIVHKKAILVLLTAQSITDVENIAKVIIDFKQQNPDQFIMVSFMGDSGVKEGRRLLVSAGILEYDYPRKAIMSYSRLLKQKKWQNKKEYILEQFDFPNNLTNLKSRLKLENKFCTNSLTGEILESFNINYSKEILVKSNDELEDVIDKFGNNLLVARISSPDIPHKTDIGGVILNIKSKKEAINAYNTILNNVQKKQPNALIKGITFSNMIIKTESTQEIFIGFKRDISFGNILIVGLGGIYVNVFEDVSRRVGLISKIEIDEMFKELKSYPILEGVRGQKGINFDKLIDIIFKLQYIFHEFKDITEIDINPVFSNDIDSVVVDAKFYL